MDLNKNRMSSTHGLATLLKGNGLRTLSLLISIFVAGFTYAEPYALPGDVQFRHDLEYLADRNLLTIPITSWPISWADVSAAMDSIVLPDDAPPSTHAAVTRLRNKVSRSTLWGIPEVYGEVALADNRTQLRTFEETPRGSVTIGGVMEVVTESFAAKLKVTLLSDTDDDRSARLDGSYLGYIWKNMAFTFGLQEQWWGPGHVGSMLLSNNARPVPGLSIRRNNAVAFEHPWLRWIGPWTAQLFAGNLESGRAVSDPYFLGARVVAKPLRSLEIGVSRTAQWGGDGRPETFESLIDLIIGRDNVMAGQSRSDEPGNQLAGFDARFSTRIVTLPTTLYGQVIGEDEAGGFPSRYMGQLGVSVSLPIAWRDSSLRVNLEYSDSTCQFYESSRLYNCAYNHSIYQDGYRYYGNSIGHSTDNDSQQTALLVTLNTNGNQNWTGLIRTVKLNRGGPTDTANPLTATRRDVQEIELYHSRPFYSGHLQLGLGLNSSELIMDNTSDTDLRVFAKWSGKQF